jgi:hypothetical protein
VISDYFVLSALNHTTPRRRRIGKDLERLGVSRAWASQQPLIRSFAWSPGLTRAQKKIRYDGVYQCRTTLPTAFREARNSIASATFSIWKRPPITGFNSPVS